MKRKLEDTALNHSKEKKSMVSAIQELESELQLRKQKSENESTSNIQELQRLKCYNEELNLQVSNSFEEQIYIYEHINLFAPL